MRVRESVLFMDTDVIVIGAGVAGLAAAGELARYGLRVRILEARDRLGGRLWSVGSKHGGPSVELGAEFVHGGNPAIRALLRQAGIKTRSTEANMWWRTDGSLTLIPDFWERISRAVDRVPKKNHGWSLNEFLKKTGDRLPAEDRWLLEHYAPSFDAAPIDKLSAFALRSDHAGADNTDLKADGRYDSVVVQLQSQLRKSHVAIDLNSEVTNVSWKRGGVAVTVHFSKKQGGWKMYRAKAAVITLPLGVLQSGKVRFSPMLGRKQAVIDQLGWGRVVRMTLRFRAGFWAHPWIPPALRAKGGRKFGFVNAPGELFPVWWALSAPAPVLTAWAGGEASTAVSTLSAAKQVDAAVRSLAHILGTTQRNVRAQLLEAHTHDWINDPYTLGAYSYAKAGIESGPSKLAMPLVGTLYFAGEATAAEIGTVHGAIDSGLKAARLIIARDKKRAARPQS